MTKINCCDVRRRRRSCNAIRGDGKAGATTSGATSRIPRYASDILSAGCNHRKMLVFFPLFSAVINNCSVLFCSCVGKTHALAQQTIQVIGELEERLTGMMSKQQEEVCIYLSFCSVCAHLPCRSISFCCPWHSWFVANLIGHDQNRLPAYRQIGSCCARSVHVY